MHNYVLAPVTRTVSLNIVSSALCCAVAEQSLSWFSVISVYTCISVLVLMIMCKQFVTVVCVCVCVCDSIFAVIISLFHNFMHILKNI